MEMAQKRGKAEEVKDTVDSVRKAMEKGGCK